jgi:hypothetical protein
MTHYQLPLTDPLHDNLLYSLGHTLTSSIEHKPPLPQYLDLNATSSVQNPFAFDGFRLESTFAETTRPLTNVPLPAHATATYPTAKLPGLVADQPYLCSPLALDLDASENYLDKEVPYDQVDYGTAELPSSALEGISLPLDCAISSPILSSEAPDILTYDANSLLPGSLRYHTTNASPNWYHR